MTQRQVWQLGSKALDCSRPRVIAIVNATPDSFFAGSRITPGSGMHEALQALLAQEPDAVDIGGQSSRPGSARVPAAEEIGRVIPVIEALRQLAPDLPVTVDTYWAAVARAALEAGADGINDISAGTLDPELLQVVAQAGCGYVLMHMQGTPETMQQQPEYADCVLEVADFLSSNLRRVEATGIQRECIVLDPGVGFGKLAEDNLALVRQAARLVDLGRPLLYGISRKSFIGKTCGVDDPVDRLPGTLGVTWELLNRGVMLHRVHDPGAVRQLCRMWEALHPIAVP